MTARDLAATRVVAVGVHVLDVHVRHVETLPEGSEGQLVEQVSLSPAGTAGGTAVVLAKLGLQVSGVGATGRDPAGRLLRTLLSDHGVDVSGLVERDEQTSASVIPVRPNGDRPAWHCIGANGAFTLDDVDLDLVAAADLLHLGGPEFLGGEAAGRLLGHARAHGTVTSMDLLAPGDPDMLAWVADALPHVDHLLPNDEQLRGLTGIEDLTEAARALVGRGVGRVAVTAGGDGALVVSADEAVAVPAYDVTVVDTTGCGDAFSAGYLAGVLAGRSPVAAAAWGNAAAAQVAQGLGTDHGDYDLATVAAYAEQSPTRPAGDRGA
ncbi:sugar kinase [Nocardioides sp. HDW12B]|uniref:carbohydrate kinase family protein n=1 Tax=Nocardioides sp. HDW12B TaxID=2714939 RepID=UPI0014097EB9|nr:sugar kinase [Nocardioides sp. HDW12B]QIK65263.1 sugar kinase [Nocardioides sp. HDW12B]